MIVDSNATVAAGTHGLDASNVEAWPCRPRRTFTTYDKQFKLPQERGNIERGTYSMVYAR